MPDIVFPGIAKSTDGINQYLFSQFGITGRHVGESIVVTERDAEIGFGPSEFLTLHRQIPLREGKETEIANELFAQISDEVREAQVPVPPGGRVNVPGDFGLLTEVAAATVQLATEPYRGPSKSLAGSIIPVLRDKLGARFVTGVSVNAGHLQSHISFAKIGLLAGRFTVADAQRLLREQKAMAGALPSALDSIAYVDSLMRFTPLALTLPVHKGNCAWHFQAEAMWQFHHEVVNGFLEEFTMGLSPLADQSNILGLSGLGNMGEANIWRYLRLVVGGVNRLLSYVVDPRNFAIPGSGEVDFLRQVQAHSALHLLFADLAAINFSMAAHSRASFAMSALDKLANLRTQLGGIGGNEGSAFQGLCSVAQRNELKRSLIDWCQAPGYADLGRALEGTVERCFDSVHSYLDEQAGGGRGSEAGRLARLWSQRNVRHGAFLQRGQFEQLFLESHGTVPSALSSIPFLLVLGLVADPSSFLRFRPVVQP
jgi:hypothetical protein